MTAPLDLDAIRERARSFAITRTAVKASMGTPVAGDAADVASDVWQAEVERLRAESVPRSALVKMGCYCSRQDQLRRYPCLHSKPVYVIREATDA